MKYKYLIIPLFASAAAIPAEARPNPTLSVADFTCTEGGDCRAVVSAAGPVQQPVSFDYRTVGSTAQDVNDYLAVAGRQTVRKGTKQITITFRTVQNDVYEDPERVDFVISSVNGSVIADPVGVGTIIDDDPKPVDPPPVTWSKCADEGAICYIEGAPAHVRYGANDTFVVAGGLVDKQIECTNARWGGDPVPNVPKICQTDGTPGKPPTPTEPPVDPPPAGDGLEPLPDAEGNILSPTLDGIVGLRVPDHDYLTSLQPAWGTGAIPEQYPAGPGITGDYRQICGAGPLANNDFILYPKQPGKAHLHRFNGNEDGSSAFATADTLISHGRSTCNWRPEGFAVQRSAYWNPALMTYKTVTDPVTGVSTKQLYVINYDLTSLYYKQLPDAGPNKAPECGPPGEPRADGKGFYIGICRHFPNGLAMIVGNMMDPADPNKFGPEGYRMDAQPLDFNCAEARNGGTVGVYMTLADLKKGSPQCSLLLQRASFPDCWDGKYLWRPDRKHVVFGSYGDWGYYRCPVSNPYKITGLMVSYFYTIADDEEVQGLHLSSDFPGEVAGIRKHTDAKLVWDERVKQMQLDGCIRGRLNCSGGDLGNGKMLIYGNQPHYGWKNPDRLTPASALQPQPEAHH
jgi:hypothetical protein